MYYSISKCNLKMCNCCCKSTIKYDVNLRRFSVVTSSDATNPDPSSHIPFGLNFLFPNFESNESDFMRGSRKFFQRGSTLMGFYCLFVMEREDPNSTTRGSSSACQPNDI